MTARRLQCYVCTASSTRRPGIANQRPPRLISRADTDRCLTASTLGSRRRDFPYRPYPPRPEEYDAPCADYEAEHGLSVTDMQGDAPIRHRQRPQVIGLMRVVYTRR